MRKLVETPHPTTLKTIILSQNCLQSSRILIEARLVIEDSLQEMIELACELFGMKAVIILSLPYINSVKTMGGVRQLKDTNAMIHKLIHNWPSGKHGVNRVQVLDFSTFADSWMEWNARLMGMDTSDANYTLENLKFPYTPKGMDCCKSIAQVCVKRVPDQSIKCEP
jgi:hypothetical protein